MARRRWPVAETERARGQSREDFASQTALGFALQIVQIALGHCSEDTDHQGGDLAAIDREELNLAECQAVVEKSDVRKPAAEAIQRFDDHNVKDAALGVGKQALVLPAVRSRARNRGICVSCDDRPAVRSAVAPTALDLVVDRLRPLLVGGITGVNRSALTICGLVLNGRLQLSLQKTGFGRGQLALSPPNQRLIIGTMRAYVQEKTI